MCHFGYVLLGQSLDTDGFLKVERKDNHFRLVRTRCRFAAFMGYLYVCTNPFIYATKFDPVKRILLGLIKCKKTTQPLESI